MTPPAVTPEKGISTAASPASFIPFVRGFNCDDRSRADTASLILGRKSSVVVVIWVLSFGPNSNASSPALASALPRFYVKRLNDVERTSPLGPPSVDGEVRSYTLRPND